MAQHEADFVMQNGRAIYPEVEHDGLEMYLDTKGKKNTDRHNNTLLDMSGNARHGKLNNFAYEKLSGYTPDGGLVFDGIDDKLVLKNTEEVEVVSGNGVENLLDYEEFRDHPPHSSYPNSNMLEFYLEPDTSYTLSTNVPRASTPSSHPLYFNGINSNDLVSDESPMTVKTDSNGYLYVLLFERREGGDKLYDGTYWVQLEKGDTATPYIPTAKMTYQLNNNIISYGEGGKISWVKDGKVMERRGINISTNRWSNNYGGEKIKISPSGFIISKDTHGNSGAYQWINKVNIGDKVFFRFDFTSESEYRPYVYYDNRSFGQSGEKQPKNTWGTYFFVIENKNGGEPITLSSPNDTIGTKTEYRNVQIINLTATFGAGNEPTLEEIQADPGKWQWLPNPMDLLEAKELEGNIIGDLEDLVDAEVRDQQSGTEIYTDKADDSVVHVEVDGKSIGGGSGKNLLMGDSREPISFSFSGHNDSNTFRVNPTYRDKLITGGTFAVSADITHTSGDAPVILMVSFRNSSGGAVRQPSTSGRIEVGNSGKLVGQITVPDMTNMDVDYVEVHLRHGSTLAGTSTGTISNVQLEEGSTATAYEPPAPTPDYPIEIHSLNDFDVVSSVGRENYLRNSKEKTLTPRNNGVAGDNYNFERLNYPTVNGQTYTISADVEITNGTFSQISVLVNYRNTGPSNQSVPIRNGKITRTYVAHDTMSNNAVLLYAGLSGGTRGNGVIFRNIKIEKGNKATPYSPAPEDISESDNHPLIDKINLSLSEPLRNVGDVKDRLFRDSDGLWKVERSVGEATLDGSRYWVDWTISGNSNKTYYTQQIDGFDSTLSTPIISHFRNTRTSRVDDEVGYNLNGAYNTFPVTVPVSLGENVTEWRDWLSKNNVILIYALNNPEIETLDQELQDKLNNLRSFQDSNYVYTIISDKTDNLSPVVQENLKPTLHTEFLAKDYLKENRTINNLLMWDRPLNDDELLHQNRLFHRRFNFRSDTIKGEPVVWNVNLLNGGVYAHSLEQNYTIEI